MRLLRHEFAAWADGFTAVAGLDEAGRGPLAGPVVAAAILIPRNILEVESETSFAGIKDSKTMTARARALIFELLKSRAGILHGIGLASVEEIDRLNILRATHLAMQRALNTLGPGPDLALVDGLPVPNLPLRSRSIVHGDAESLSIAAASVLAKVTRDRLMEDYDRAWPHYGFAGHKGYGTQAHLEALRAYGPSPIHRRSFDPVRQMTLGL